MEPVDEKGEFEIRIKAWSEYVSYTYAYHPFDLVGWDGYLFPWIFNIDDFEPITGSLHMPPPIHQTFSSKNFVVCSFVPRLYDYHPNAVPVPYHHSNLQSEEVLYYVNGNFMSRRGIERGSITLHPAFIPHGPHPGTIESSLGKTRTDEIAVMVDTFEPLLVAENALDLDDTNYPYSWN
jgi:homogentisate 1,2-dioxygenase